MTDSSLSRREFTSATLQSLLTLAFLETLSAGDAFAAEIQPIAAQWLKDLDELGRDVKGEAISQLAWQKKVEELFAKIELSELMTFLDFDKLSKMELRSRGERSMRPVFPKVEGLPTELVFGHQVFGLKQGTSVVPHGHDNMCTAFLILEGEFRGRLYDRLEDDEESMILKPTVDETFKVGQASTISEKKDNVHWFKANSDRGFIFNIHVLNLHAGKTGRVYVDPNGKQIGDGKIRARKLKSSEAYKLYG
jgi:quercetin dioxygenase-like cupin family protein